MLIIISDNKFSGVKTWLNHFILKYNDTILFYELNNDVLKLFEDKNNTIYVNNYTKKDLYTYINTNIINASIYFIIHSDICPSNSFYINNINCFTGVVCISKYIYDKISKLYPDTKIIYQPNDELLQNNTIIDCNSIVNYNNIVNYTDHIENRVYKFAYMGRLSPEKNLIMLFDALYTINTTQITPIEFELHVYGCNNNETAYEKYIKQYVDELKIKNIFFHNYTTNIYEIYSIIDCIILPSVHEGLPFCLLEANFYNKEFIANNFCHLEYHLLNKNNLFTFYGLDMNMYENKLYINNYNELLKHIGYIEIYFNKHTPKWVIKKTIHMLPCKSLLTSPRLVNRINECYEKNVNLLITFILQKIEK